MYIPLSEYPPILRATKDLQRASSWFRELQETASLLFEEAEVSVHQHFYAGCAQQEERLATSIQQAELKIDFSIAVSFLSVSSVSESFYRREVLHPLVTYSGVLYTELRTTY